MAKYRSTLSDLADAAMIARAVRFDATIFLGVGQFHTETFTDLAAARQRASQLTAQVSNGRRGMVYAIIPEGRSTLVPPSYQPGATNVTTDKIALSTTEICALTAAVKGETGIKRANSKDAAAKRFITVATDAGIKDALSILQAPTFDEAKAMLPLTIPASLSHEAHAQIKAAARQVADKIVANRAKRVLDAVPQAAIDTEVAAANARIAKQATGKRAAILEAAQRGELPSPPDFSAATHARFRNKLGELVKLVEAGDIAALKAFPINPISSSPRAMDKYRNLAVTALEARMAGKAA